MEGNSIIGLAGGFIALSIMLGIGTLILGGSVTDCEALDGYGANESGYPDSRISQQNKPQNRIVMQVGPNNVL